MTDRRLTCALAALLLAACASPEPDPGAASITASITVASGGFFGGFSTQIFADGTLVSLTRQPGKPPVRHVTQAGPRAYAKAVAVLAAQGAATRHRMVPQTVQCLDYGSDQVSAAPPVAGFDQLSSACPDPALSDLMTQVLASLAQP